MRNVGEPFYRLVTNRNGVERKRKFIKVECKCGYTWDIYYENINKTKMCRRCAGIYRGNLQSRKSRSKKTKSIKYKYIISKCEDYRIYNIWQRMRQRCNNPSKKDKDIYKNVSYTMEWENFDNFVLWAMKNGYSNDLTLDRIDPNGDYTPTNCRWVDYTVQSQNRRMLKNNTSGYTGVFYNKPRSGKVKYKNTHKKPWYFIIIYKGKRKQFSGYTTAEEAYLARLEEINNNYKGLVLNTTKA